MAITVTAIEKKGPVIICMTDDSQNRTYKLDFKEGRIYGIAGRPLASTAPILNKIPDALANEANNLYTALRLFANGDKQGTNYYSIVESLLSYPDLVSQDIDSSMIRYIIHNCDGKLPKGYVAWCRKNNQQFNLCGIASFVTEQKLSTWNRQLADVVNKFSDGTGFDLAHAADYDQELCTSLIHIANNSLKRYEINDLVSKIRGILRVLHSKPELRPYLDDTKNATAALQILEDVFNKRRNDRILENEAKIATLDGLIIDDFVIKVPSTMSDFVEEGEQQHNCVGYYYHDEIAEGTQLIYFLRQRGNPNKSYITCRFNVARGATVEHRLQHNIWFEGEDLFKKIDNMIKAIV